MVHMASMCELCVVYHRLGLGFASAWGRIFFLTWMLSCLLCFSLLSLNLMWLSPLLTQTMILKSQMMRGTDHAFAVNL